jgi:hypothetical protein
MAFIRMVYITKNKYCKECAREKHKEIKRKTWLNNKDKYRPARQIENPSNLHG